MFLHNFIERARYHPAALTVPATHTTFVELLIRIDLQVATSFDTLALHTE